MKTPALCLLLGLAIPVVSAASESVATAEQIQIALDWDTLKDLQNVRAGALAADDSATAQDIAEAYVARAADLREFYTAQPEHEAAKEAQALEAMALVRAGWAGDTSQEERRERTVADVRGDEAIPMELRSMIAAGFENLKIRRQTGLSRDERLAAFEATVRGLIAEFGDPIGYESLFGIACSRSEESAVRVAQEMLEMPAPVTVKWHAETLLRRHAMIGTALAEQVELADPEARTTLDSFLGRPLVIYAWSTRQKASLAIAKKLSRELPPGVGLVGVNLDPDTNAANAAIRAQGLRGAQSFEPGGPEGPMAHALALDAAPLVLVLDAKGIVTSVTAHRELDKTIADLVTP